MFFLTISVQVPKWGQYVLGYATIIKAMSLRGKHFNVIKLRITFNDIITMNSSPIDLQRTNDPDRG